MLGRRAWDGETRERGFVLDFATQTEIYENLQALRGRQKQVCLNMLDGGGGGFRGGNESNNGWYEMKMKPNGCGGSETFLGKSQRDFGLPKYVLR